MGKRHWSYTASLEASRASKRQYFDPTTITRKPKHQWITLDVGQSFTVSAEETKITSIRTSANYWTNITGRVFSVVKTDTGCKVTRTD